MAKKIGKWVKHLHRGVFSKFPEETEHSIRRNFIFLAVVALVVLGLVVLFS